MEHLMSGSSRTLYVTWFLYFSMPSRQQVYTLLPTYSSPYSSLNISESTSGSMPLSCLFQSIAIVRFTRNTGSLQMGQPLQPSSSTTFIFSPIFASSYLSRVTSYSYRFQSSASYYFFPDWYHSTGSFMTRLKFKMPSAKFFTGTLDNWTRCTKYWMSTVQWEHFVNWTVE